MKEYRREERDLLAGKIDACRSIHFTGIGGISMSTIAALAKERCFEVSGSDRSKSEICASLEKKGIKITYGHFAESADNCDALVYTAAVDETNPEIARAIERGVLLDTRRLILGSISLRFLLASRQSSERRLKQSLPSLSIPPSTILCPLSPC